MPEFYFGIFYKISFYDYYSYCSITKWNTWFPASERTFSKYMPLANVLLNLIRSLIVPFFAVIVLR